jgi:hypothetical protein
MRRWAFVIVIVGMFVLVWFLGFDVEIVRSFEDLSGLEINQKVELNGTVVGERRIANGKILDLDSNISLVCSCLGDFLGLEISVEGVVSEYDGKRQVDVLKLDVLS